MRFFSEGEQKGKHMLAETHWMALMVHAIPFSLHVEYFIYFSPFLLEPRSQAD
jgi:hypothetical protein